MKRHNLALTLCATALLAACGGGAGTVGVQDLSSPANPVRTAAVFIPQGDDRCPYGGAEIRSGIDRNGNGRLDEDEVAASDVVCNGAPGLTSLVRLQDEPPGTVCPAGGVRLETGLDQNQDGRLDDEEIDPAQTRYLCQGQDGAPGKDAVPTLVSLTDLPPGPECPAGGTAIHSGPDTNGDGLLGEDEIDQTRYVCHGQDGVPGKDAVPTLVSLTDLPPGPECPAGGTAIHSGPDTNGDGLLGEDEIQSTHPVCNGRDGAGNVVAGLFTITEELPGPNCPAGGTRIDFGLDTDGDGILSLDEITQTGYVCNGQDGLGGQAVSTIYCEGSLENFPGVFWNYQVQQLASGDVIATAGISDNYISTSRTVYYSLFQVGFLEAPVQLTHDVAGPANYGQWEIKLDRQTLVTTVTYNDIDLLANPTTWTMQPVQCIVNRY